MAGSAARVARTSAPAGQALLLVPLLARRPRPGRLGRPGQAREWPGLRPARHWAPGSPVWRHARYRAGGRGCPRRPAYSLIRPARTLIWRRTRLVANPGCAGRNLHAGQEFLAVKR